MWPFHIHKKSSRNLQEGTLVAAQETGRRFRSDVPYPLPKDAEEGGRLNLQHYLFRYVLKGNYTAPLDEKKLTHVLDIGAGTGIWGQELASQFPQARVFGLDLESPQTVSLAATAAQPPSNYHYVQGNVLQGLPFPDHTFDFTHQRMLCAGIPDKNWPFVLHEIWRVTRPGGWIELLEVSDLVNPGQNTYQAFDTILRYLSARGISYQKFRRFDQLIKEATPLIHMKLTNFDVPIGGREHVGKLMEQDALASFKALAPKICQEFHISPQNFDSWLEELPKECKKLHSAFRFSLVVAQKAF